MCEPVLASLAYRVVRVAGFRDDSLVEVPVQLPELIHDSSLGLAADFPPMTLPVCGISQRYFTAPQPRTVPVTFRVTAGTAVLEGDPVFSAPAAGRHATRLVPGGDYQW